MLNITVKQIVSLTILQTISTLNCDSQQIYTKDLKQKYDSVKTVVRFEKRALDSIASKEAFLVKANDFELIQRYTAAVEKRYEIRSDIQRNYESYFSALKTSTMSFSPINKSQINANDKLAYTIQHFTNLLYTQSLYSFSYKIQALDAQIGFFGDDFFSNIVKAFLESKDHPIKTELIESIRMNWNKIYENSQVIFETLKSIPPPLIKLEDGTQVNFLLQYLDIESKIRAINDNYFKSADFKKIEMVDDELNNYLNQKITRFIGDSRDLASSALSFYKYLLNVVFKCDKISSEELTINQ